MKDLRKKEHGTTLIETLIAASFFIIFSLAIYQLYAKMIDLSSRIKIKTMATQIASEQIEFIRNLQYADIGIVSGIPAGVINANKVITKNNITFSISTVIRNLDLPADGTLGGTPNDTSPADNKLVFVEVSCTSCNNPVSVEFTTTIAPKSLETENGNGALVIKVIDANGLPVPNATVNIENNTTSPSINFTDSTDSYGVLTVVDAPPSNESYHITVSKSGYSTEQTYVPGGVGNPNPSKPYLTVAMNTVSQSTFSIDKLSSFVLGAQSSQCSPITGVSGSFLGSKLIGTSPDVFKNNIPFSLTGVINNLNNIEWDTYTASINGSSYDIAGTNPIFPLSVLPNSNQQVTLTLKPSSTNRLVVAVTDTSGLPIAGATVNVVGPSSSFSAQTSVGSVSQTDWSGGGGQSEFVDQSKFASSDGGISYDDNPGLLELLSTGPSSYISNGELISSTIDLGEASTFQQLSWFPSNQPSGIGSSPVRFQIATNTDNLTWNYLGPDGTDSTYYTSPVSDIALVHNGDRYLRYKILLSTTDSSKTPSISDVAFTYTSGCLPPGQIDFGGLNSGSYTIEVSKSGYTTTSKTITINTNTYESIQINP